MAEGVLSLVVAVKCVVEVLHVRGDIHTQVGAVAAQRENCFDTLIDKFIGPEVFLRNFNQAEF
jgi:hypothetical protein